MCLVLMIGVPHLKSPTAKSLCPSFLNSLDAIDLLMMLAALGLFALDVGIHFCCLRVSDNLLLLSLSSVTMHIQLLSSLRLIVSPGRAEFVLFGVI